MNTPEMIKNRRSTRTFDVRPLEPAHAAALLEYINGLVGFDGTLLPFQIVEMKNSGKTMKLDYGMIRGHHTYLLAQSPANTFALVNYGYVAEKAVLRATSLGLVSCWVGYFDRDYFSGIQLDEGYKIPAIVILGYAADKTPGLEKFMRFAVKASKRYPWEKLFFNHCSGAPLLPDEAGRYREPLEMLRLAPSAGNTQPWRIFFDSQQHRFHFFKKPINKKYEQMGLHDIDLGIAMSHFELSAEHCGLPGKWINQPAEIVNGLNEAKELQYIITWQCR